MHKTFALSLLLALLSIHTTSAIGEKPIPWETLKQTSDRTGYGVGELQKYFPAFEPQIDTTGLATDRFKAPPAPGIHPRIYFNPEDLPDLRDRIQNTKAGQVAWARFNDMQGRLLTGDNASFAPLFESLQNGATDLGDRPKDGYGMSTLLAYEAFRCLIEDDKVMGKKVAAAAAALAKIADKDLLATREKLKAKGKENNWQEYQFTVYHHNLGLIYDFAHGYMTPAQRDTVRTVISHAITDAWIQGSDSLPAWMVNTSNWITGFNKIGILALAIEGEPGDDPDTYRNCVESMNKWLHLGVLDRGAPFEGMGKNQLAMEHLVPMAKRGHMHIAFKNARAHFDDFHLHAMQPFGYGWTYLTDWGGSTNQSMYVDVETMKYAYPDDPKIDFVYRNAVGEDYKRHKDRNTSFTWKMHDNLMRVIFAQDFDDSKTWEQALAAATQDEDLTYFSEDRGQLFTRDRWDKDAVQLGFLPRNAPGGHVHADRNDFVLSGLGRVWVERVTMGGGGHMGNIGESRYHNIVLIDGMGQAFGGTRPARVVSLSDEDTVTIAVGDAKDAYSAQTSRDKAFPTDPSSPNDYRLTPSKQHPWMALPWGELPDWYTSLKPTSPRTLKPWNPVQRAFRTAALVRGEHPYALIVDDIQKDDEPHNYDWLAQIPNDLELIRIQVADTRNSRMIPAGYKGPKEAFIADMILGDDKDRRLLVRVLQNDQEENAPQYRQPGFVETYLKDMRWHNPGKRLVIPSRSISPNYKVLLFPHKKGDALPVTLWNKDKTEVSVTWDGQSDNITFKPNDEGYTEVSIQRQ